MNSVVVSGNLTRDPEVRMAGTTPVCILGIAVNGSRKNKETGEWEDIPNFFDVIVWGSRGEFWGRNLSKGDKVVVFGKLKWSSWKTPDGQNRSKVEIVADDIESMMPKQDRPKPEYPEPVPVEVLGEEIPF